MPSLCTCRERLLAPLLDLHNRSTLQEPCSSSWTEYRVSLHENAPFWTSFTNVVDFLRQSDHGAWEVSLCTKARDGVAGLCYDNGAGNDQVSVDAAVVMLVETAATVNLVRDLRIQKRFTS